MADPSPSRRGERRRLLARRFVRNRTAVAGTVVLLALVALAVLGPVLSPWDVDDVDRTAFLKPPGGDHLFGTTQSGRDMLALTLHGLGRSLLIGFAVAFLSTAIAAIVGAFAAYFGGWTERVSLWTIDLLLVIPAFLLVALVTGGGVQGGSSTWTLVALLAVFGWMLPARVVRSMTHAIREREFVLAARFMGLSGPRIVFRHLLPNLSSLLIIDMTAERQRMLSDLLAVAIDRVFGALAVRGQRVVEHRDGGLPTDIGQRRTTACQGRKGKGQPGGGREDQGGVSTVHAM